MNSLVRIQLILLANQVLLLFMQYSKDKKPKSTPKPLCYAFIAANTSPLVSLSINSGGTCYSSLKQSCQTILNARNTRPPPFCILTPLVSSNLSCTVV